MNHKKLTILKGKGINQHTLYGNFDTEEQILDYQEIEVKKDSLLKHENSDGSFSQEHKTLEVKTGIWVTGKQVEFNPFLQEITNIWD